MVGMNTVDIYLLAQQQAFRIHDAMRRRVVVPIVSSSYDAMRHRVVVARVLSSWDVVESLSQSCSSVSLYRLILVVAHFITDWSGSSSFMRVALRTYFEIESIYFPRVFVSYNNPRCRIQ